MEDMRSRYKCEKMEKLKKSSSTNKTQHEGKLHRREV